MSTYRENLPQCGDTLFITDGGLELYMIFQKRVDLPYAGAFIMLENEADREQLREYFRGFADIARDNGVGLVMETATWRANPAWGEKLGYSVEALEKLNAEAVKLNRGVREEYAEDSVPIVICGMIGPRGDGYVVGETMTPEEAESYHDMQSRVFAQSGADMIAAVTMTYVEEAIGAVRAARKHAMPVAISFTVETDGKLPCGLDVKDAIEQVDAATDAYAAYYMINCAHTTHFDKLLASDAPWIGRLGGIQPNASPKSHAELDESEELDPGDPTDLARRSAELHARLPALHVMGGCCGTDHTHIEAICKACLTERSE